MSDQLDPNCEQKDQTVEKGGMQENQREIIYLKERLASMSETEQKDERLEAIVGKIHVFLPVTMKVIFE